MIFVSVLLCGMLNGFVYIVKDVIVGVSKIVECCEDIESVGMLNVLLVGCKIFVGLLLGMSFICFWFIVMLRLLVWWFYFGGFEIGFSWNRFWWNLRYCSYLFYD